MRLFNRMILISGDAGYYNLDDVSLNHVIDFIFSKSHCKYSNYVILK